MLNHIKSEKFGMVGKVYSNSNQNREELCQLHSKASNHPLKYTKLTLTFACLCDTEPTLAL